MDAFVWEKGVLFSLKRSDCALFVLGYEHGPRRIDSSIIDRLDFDWANMVNDVIIFGVVPRRFGKSRNNTRAFSLSLCCIVNCTFGKYEFINYET